MPYDFILMRLPRPSQADIQPLNDGPQPILRRQIAQVVGEMAGVQAQAEGRYYSSDSPGGPHIEIHLDPKEPVEFLTVEFDRYDSESDYAAARAVVDALCAGLRLTITDDPHPDALGPDDEAGGGLIGRIRKLFGA
jgi:hypothetical protein